MRSFVAVLLTAGLAAACSSSPEPQLPAARADGTPATTPTTLAAPAGDLPAAAAEPHGGAAGMGNPHGKPGPRADEVPLAKVERAPAPDGRTVAEIHAQAKQLHDKNAAVRGTVVKFLSGIMGRNWVHVRDGSGTPGKGDNDLTITTSETVAVGDVVLATGVVRAEKDFGSGYAYGVIMEDARFVAQPR